MVLNKIALFLLLTISVSIHAQNTMEDKAVVLKNGTELYQKIYEITNKHVDSLSQLLGRGSFYIRFTLDEKGKPTDIVTSKREPGMLINLIKQVLESENILLQDAVKNSTCFILPVTYDYMYHGNITEIMHKAPKVDLKSIFIDKQAESFDTFFNIKNEKGNVIGINSVFLPWMEFRGKVE